MDKIFVQNLTCMNDGCFSKSISSKLFQLQNSNFGDIKSRLDGGCLNFFNTINLTINYCKFNNITSND